MSTSGGFPFRRELRPDPLGINVGARAKSHVGGGLHLAALLKFVMSQQNHTEDGLWLSEFGCR
jgi:hypothetical protein